MFLLSVCSNEEANVVESDAGAQAITLAAVLEKRKQAQPSRAKLEKLRMALSNLR